MTSQVHEDSAVLLAIKDAELGSLRQQMAQLADDLRRNAAALATKDAEATKLRQQVDAVRGMLIEKDVLFAEFQEQVRELEALHMKEVEKSNKLELEMVARQKEWQQQQDAEQQSREDEVARLQDQLKQRDEEWSKQLMQTRQTALDESTHRSNMQEASLQRSADERKQLQQQIEDISSALRLKESELEAAHRQLGSALESNQQLALQHAKAMSFKDALAAQLQQRVDQLTASSRGAAADHEANMFKLISSVHQMQESCQAQALELQEHDVAQKKLREECLVLKKQAEQHEATILKLQTEKGVLESALQREVTSQARCHAQVNIIQAKLTEVVKDLQQRCTAAEESSSQLVKQLKQERDQLVDAIADKIKPGATSLTAELISSLEADVDKLQQQLHSSNRHLQFSKHVSAAAQQRCGEAEGDINKSSRRPRDVHSLSRQLHAMEVTPPSRSGARGQPCPGAHKTLPAHHSGITRQQQCNIAKGILLGEMPLKDRQPDAADEELIAMAAMAASEGARRRRQARVAAAATDSSPGVGAGFGSGTSSSTDNKALQQQQLRHLAILFPSRKRLLNKLAESL
eukprot:gene11308-11458_t